MRRELATDQILHARREGEPSPSTADAVRVLLVDGNRGDATLIADMLGEVEPAAVLTAAPFSEAVVRVAAGLADLVLLDVTVSDSSGLEGVRSLQEAAFGVPVVVLSAGLADAVRPRAIAAGAQDAIDKNAITAQGFVRAMRSAVQRHRNVQHWMNRALSDPLTKLANRALFTDRLALALERARHTGAPGTKLVVMYLDLDGFKSINDELGHQAGDAILIEVAVRLQGAIRSHDTAARLGGDEFAIICEALPAVDDAISMARAITASVSAPFDFDGESPPVSSAIGVAVAAPLDEDAEALLRRADAAMFAAKREGRSRVALSDVA